MKLNMNRKQWEDMGKVAGWVDKDGDVEDPDIATEERMVTFYDSNSGSVLERETFFIEGPDESTRFEKLEQEIDVYITDHYGDSDDIEYEHVLVNVT